MGKLRTAGGGTFARLLVAGVLFGMLVTAAVAGATGAVFTDNAAGSSILSSGTLDIATVPATAVISAGNMAPGDKVVSPLTVRNDGSLALRYAVKSTTDENVLAGALLMTVKTGVLSCDTAGFATGGTVLYGPGPLGSTTGTVLFGDPTQGAQVGDRTLSAAASEALCFQVEFPLSVSSTTQGLSSTATLEVIAEQTANN